MPRPPSADLPNKGVGQVCETKGCGRIFDPTHNSRYVAVQNFDGGGAMVIRNTFNEQCAPTSLCGVGTNSAFGSGSVGLTRLALVNGLECSP